MADTATAPTPAAPAGPAPQAASLDAAAEAAALARMGALRTALSAALKGALAGTDFEVREKGVEKGAPCRASRASSALAHQFVFPVASCVPVLSLTPRLLPSYLGLPPLLPHLHGRRLRRPV